jgi:hypothetical protein
VLVVAGTTVAVVAASDIVCTCAHGDDHGSCPMHGTAADSTRCRLQSTQNDLGIALMSVLGPLMLPATSIHAIAEPSSSRVSKGFDALPSDWTVPPEPPPPRS